MRILLIGGNGTNCKIRDPDEHAVTSPPPESVRLRSGLRTFSYSYQENSALAIRVGREEPGHLVVVESKAGRAQALGVRRQIHLASQNAGFQMHRAISAVS